MLSLLGVQLCDSLLGVQLCDMKLTDARGRTLETWMCEESPDDHTPLKKSAAHFPHQISVSLFAFQVPRFTHAGYILSLLTQSPRKSHTIMRVFLTVLLASVRHVSRPSRSHCPFTPSIRHVYYYTFSSIVGQSAEYSRGGLQRSPTFSAATYSTRHAPSNVPSAYQSSHPNPTTATGERPGRPQPADR